MEGLKQKRSFTPAVDPWGRVIATLALACSFVSHAQEVEFSRDVRPILSKHCFKCHGPDEAARKAKLRLDKRDALVGEPGGGAVLVPGHPDDSELVYRILAEEPDEVMPPPATRLALTAEQKEVLRRWVAEGAEYEQHWAFVPPRQADLPEVRRPRWVRNPIDRFVLAELESREMKPSREADRQTLARRLHLDLLGLPPTPSEVEAFVGDVSSDAYEQLVDRLLASSHYGERWARLWLDLARYADTNGYEKDRPRSMWPWRDWVINALNTDMPFDQFTIEQIAGDMLPDATFAQRVATGFHRNSMINEEGGTDPLEFRFYGVVDRVAVTGTTWLGLTVGCAQCHTHKYDPISQKEYYQLMAFLNNADEPELALEDPDVTERRAKGEEEIAKLVAGLSARWPLENTRWRVSSNTATASSGVPTRTLEDGSVLFEGEAAERDTYTVVLESDLPEITELRLEALPDPGLPKEGPGRAESGNFVLSELTAVVGPLEGGGEAVPLKFGEARADASQKDYPAEAVLDGDPKTGWAVSVGGDWHVPRELRLTLVEPLRLAGGVRITVTLDQEHGTGHLLGRVRLGAGEPVHDNRPDAERSAELVGRGFERWLTRERERVAKWELLEPVSATAKVPWLTILPDHSVFAGGDMTKSDTYDVTLRGDLAGVTALRVEVMPDERLPRGGPGRVHYEGPKGEFFLSELSAEVLGETVEFSGATESYARVTDGRRYSAALALDGDAQSGWSTSGREGEANHAVFNLTEPLPAAAEVRLELLFERYYAAGLGRFRVWVTRDQRSMEASDYGLDVQELLRRAPDELTYAQERELRTAFLWTVPDLSTAQGEIRKRRANLPAPPTTLVLRERLAENPRSTFVHHRGEFMQPREPVQPGVLSALPGLPDDAPRDRLGLAQWLVSTNHPLTARVTVNRQWAALFGQGLVRTLGDFGFQGELPSHPELLDWLAVQFMKDGWSLKKLHRLMVTSAIYRQSSRVTPERWERDPDNRWLARGPRRRLEAEMVRDSVLSVAGLLSAKVGGPSVFPPQPPGITTEGAYGPLQWKVSEGEDRYRRGLYTFMKRTAPYAMFATFDAPSGEACVARRDVSNTPLQALTLLNDEAVLEAAQALGRILTSESGNLRQKMDRAFVRCLGRLPVPKERRRLLDYWREQHDRFATELLDPAELAGDGEGAAERATWVAVARVLMNLDEFVTRI